MRRSCAVRIASSFLLLLIAVSSVGCASLPELGPFVDATLELRSAVAAVGSTVEAELQRMQGGQKYADRLAKEWAVRIQAVDALVAYAESLRAIVKAGQEGGQAARSLASSVTALAKAAQVAMPAAGAVSVATDTASFIYGQIALVRASKSLEEALMNAQPAVQRITSIIALELKKLDDILQLANADIDSARQVAHQVELGFRKALFKEQKKLYSNDPSALMPKEKARLLEINELLESTKIWYEPLQTKKEQVEKRLHAGRNLIAAAGQTTGQWAVAHEQLVLAIRDKRSINTKALVQATLEVRDLIKRIREL